MTVIKLGCDPEGFLFDGNNEAVPALGFVPGNKQEPYKLDGGAVQVDGMAIEFNIDAVDNEDDFVKNILKVTSQITQMVKDVDKDTTIRWVPVAKFRQAIWNIAPEQAKLLGCDPDYNVKGQVNANPTTKLEDNPIRTAAGHIHIGWRDELIEDPMEDSHFNMCLSIAQGFHESNLSTFLPQTLDEEERLQYYGHNGSFRPKKYGVELRAPSNVWVRTEASQRQIYRDVRGKFRELTGL